MADAAGLVAGPGGVVAVAPLVWLWEAPLGRRLLTALVAFLAGRCAYTAIEGQDRWGLAFLSLLLAGASIANYRNWRRTTA